jgi:hypothetical protein
LSHAGDIHVAIESQCLDETQWVTVASANCSEYWAETVSGNCHASTSMCIPAPCRLVLVLLLLLLLLPCRCRCGTLYLMAGRPIVVR